MAQSPALDRATQYIIDLVPPGEPTLDEFRQVFSNMCEEFAIPDGTTIEEVDAGGVPALWVTAPGAGADRTIIHFHSGGYVMGTARDYREFAARLSAASGARVLVVDYRLAPEHPYPAALDDALAAYRWVIASQDPETVALTGDSAGGGLTTATLVAVRDAGEPLPAAAALISPLTDLAATGESMTTNHEIDPLKPMNLVPMMGGAYLAGRDPMQTPLASPLYADLHGLPPMLVMVGAPEGLRDDSVRLVDRVKEAGGQAELYLAEDMVHIWTLFASFLPEGQQGIERVAEHINRHAGQPA
jgi:monoterpene epsilon-lactone hydrolase